VGEAVTNTFTLFNTGTADLTIRELTTNGAGAAQFSIVGLPASLAPVGSSDFTIAFHPTNSGDYTAALIIASDVPGVDSNYVVNLHGSAYQLSTLRGPYAGGNTITINAGTLGNGTDITNVTVGGVAATIITQGIDWVTITVPATGSAGVKDIVIQSTSVGETTFAGAYTVNPAGQIGGVIEDWTQWQEVSGLPDARMGLAASVLNGALYAVGGAKDSQICTNVYRYDGTNWTEVAGLPTASFTLAAGVLNGALYAVGGATITGFQTNVYRYDGTNWQEAAGWPAASCALAAGVLNGALYAPPSCGISLCTFRAARRGC